MKLLRAVQMRVPALLLPALVGAGVGGSVVAGPGAHADEVTCADVLNIGHRGAGQGPDENTIPHMRKAVGWGVDVVEFDIRFTSDGVLGVMHDRTVDRTTNGSGRVSRMSFRRFHGLRTASGYHPPSLGQVVEQLAPLGVGLQIHLKTGLSDQRIASVGRMLVSRGFTPDEVQFNADRLGLLRRVERITGYPTGFTYLGTPARSRISEVASYGVDVVVLDRDFVTEEWVSYARGLGVEMGARARTISPEWATSVGVRRLVVDRPQPTC